MINVTLTKAELEVAFFVGIRRKSESIFNGNNARAYGYDGKNAFEIEFLGVCGEVAAAKGTGQYWPASVNAEKNEPDVFPNYQIRTATRDNDRLIVRPNDPDDQWYILVIGYPPHFKVIGYILGRDAKQPKWWVPKEKPEDRDPCWMIPQSALIQIK